MISAMIWVYVAAILIPLGAFVVEALGGRWLGRLNAYLATGAIVTSCVLSLIGLFGYLAQAPAILEAHHAGAAAHGGTEAPLDPEGPATTVTHPHEPHAWQRRLRLGPPGDGAPRGGPGAGHPHRDLHRQPDRHHVRDGHVHRDA